ncbi:MAG: CAP domain-containing protein [Gemmataceae bacterium]
MKLRKRWFLIVGGVVMGVFCAGAAWSVLSWSGPDLTQEEQRIVDLVNDVRVLDKLPRLKLHQGLTRVARAHAQHMKEQGRLEFPFPAAFQEELATQADYTWEKYGMVADVIQGITIEQAFEKWLKVNEPLAEILSIYHEDVGVGVVIDQQVNDGEPRAVYYVALVFARKKH